MPRKSQFEDYAKDLTAEEIIEARIWPSKTWTLTKEENRGNGSHSYYWKALNKKTNHIVSSKYFQQVLTRVLLIHVNLREEETWTQPS